jgi:hypothetical protein
MAKDRLLVSEHFPQAGQTWTENPYKLAIEVCRWANHKRLTQKDIVSVSIFNDRAGGFEYKMGAVIFYWS